MLNRVLRFRRRPARALPADVEGLYGRFVAEWAFLDDDERHALVDGAATLLDAWRWEAANRFTLTDEMCAVIVGQAAWMGLGLGLDDIAGIGTSLVHPSTMTSVGSRPGPVSGLLVRRVGVPPRRGALPGPAAARVGRRAPRQPALRQRAQRGDPRVDPQAGHARRDRRRHARRCPPIGGSGGSTCAPPSTRSCATEPTTGCCATTRPPTRASSSPPPPRCSSTARWSWPRPSRRCTACSPTTSPPIPPPVAARRA